MLPVGSFFAPCGERSIEFHCASWQFAHTGLVGPCCAAAVPAIPQRDTHSTMASLKNRICPLLEPLRVAIVTKGRISAALRQNVAATVQLFERLVFPLFSRG